MSNRRRPLEAITGCMFSGKTTELHRRLERVRIAGRSFVLFKPYIDTRGNEKLNKPHHPPGVSGHEMASMTLQENIISYDQLAIMCNTAREPVDLEHVEVVGVDEAQFLDPEFVKILLELVDRGKRVIVAGLDLDFMARPFGVMPYLLALAESVTKLSAVCMQCGNDASRSQRLINGEPAPSSSPEILIGGAEQYEARCKDCFVLSVNALASPE